MGAKVRRDTVSGSEAQQMAARRNKNGKALSLFADALQKARIKAGLNSDELGDKLGYSGAMIRSVESGHRVPKPALAKAADEFFGYPDLFVMMEERLRDLPFPASYRRPAPPGTGRTVRGRTPGSPVQGPEPDLHPPLATQTGRPGGRPPHGEERLLPTHRVPRVDGAFPPGRGGNSRSRRGPAGPAARPPKAPRQYAPYH